MNRLILCEGKTDAILLSYYLGRVCGWTPCKPPKDLSIKAKAKNESVEWYSRDGEKLLICGVGGKDNFGKFFDDVIRNPLINTNAFGRISIVLDRDDRNTSEIEHDIAENVAPIFSDIKDREWKTCSYINGYGIESLIEFLLVIIPIEQQGALETLMLEAISEDPYDKNIVNNCKAFVAKIRPDADQYIKTDRLQLKANLSVTWAIQSPEKVFDFINEQINSVSWEKYKALRNCFRELETI